VNGKQTTKRTPAETKPVQTDPSLKRELDDLTEKYVEIENVNRELSQKLTELFVLYNISHILSTTFEIEEILTAIFRFFRESLEAESVHLYLLDSLKDRLNLHKVFGYSKQSKKPLFPEPGVLEKIIVSQNPLRLEKIHPASAPNSEADTYSYAGFPLITGGREVLGVLSFFRKHPAVISQTDVDFFSRISQEVASCVERALVFYRTHESTIIDDLTGIFNRRYFNQQFPVEVKRAERYKRNLSVMMIDIDDFKQINDTYGHLKGDEILRAIAGIMKNNLRKADLLFRYGGEEFVVLLPETTVQNAYRVGEKLRKKVETHFRTTDYQIADYGVTVSIGIANFPVDAYSGEKVLQLADERLYQAKNSGKNKTVASEPSPQEA